jgi:hypothetical protein
MRFRIALLILMVIPLAWAEERLDLRVSSSRPGSAVIDRGSRDGVAVGDVVLLQPRDGRTQKGTVLKVEERSSVVELQDMRFLAEPGTRGVVLITPAPEDPTPTPDGGKEPPPEPGQEPGKENGDKAAGSEPEHEPWTNKDESWEAGKPLLADLRPVRPKERGRRLFGRVYGIGALTDNPPGDFNNSLFRLGTDVTLENPFGAGGGFRFNGELAYLTEWDDNSQELDVLVRWLSYAWGGHRFAGSRWEAGRFLQHGMPEFGTLDGIEWGGRSSGGDRYGLSVGFVPELDAGFRTFNDFQVAGYYEWVADLAEQLMFGAGFQRTWRDGQSDRDLFIAKFRYVPANGWDLFGTAWIDYDSGGFELSQAVLSATRRFLNGNGVEFLYRRFAFPNFLQPLSAGGPYDRLAFNGWAWMSERSRLHGHLSGWNDDEGYGGAAELGLEVQTQKNRFDLTAFGSAGEFVNVLGARVQYARLAPNSSWDLLYEFSNHHLMGLPSDRDDLFQHRLRASGHLFMESGWDFSLYAEGLVWDDEFSWSLGFGFSRRF